MAELGTGRRLVCAAAILFAGLYLLALGLWTVGTWGLFGQPRGPLAGVFLVPLGLPWNLLGAGLPDAALPALGLGAPLVNLVLLWALCRRRTAR